MNITENMAQSVIAAARRAAESIGVPMAIAVLDAGAHLKAFARMDGALLGSVDIALGKAKTSALFGMNSETVGEFSKPGGTSPGLELTNGVLVVFAGGVALRDAKGTMIGAVGFRAVLSSRMFKSRTPPPRQRNQPRHKGDGQ